MRYYSRNGKFTYFTTVRQTHIEIADILAVYIEFDFGIFFFFFAKNKICFSTQNDRFFGKRKTESNRGKGITAQFLSISNINSEIERVFGSINHRSERREKHKVWKKQNKKEIKISICDQTKILRNFNNQRFTSSVFYFVFNRQSIYKQNKPKKSNPKRKK